MQTAVATEKQLGRYVLACEIARSNDVVWEAIDPQMHRRVAVKELLLPPTLTGQLKQERIERFFREARAAGAMSHPNIVTIHEVGEDDGRYFIAMEFLAGRDLRERLDREGALPLPEAIRIATLLCDALAYAHVQGVIHRDIKPDNVHLLPDDQVKLTDFGIARITHEDAITLDGQLFGTPSYMSPEQVVGRGIDTRSDLFSLGVVLFEMITGRKPFTGDSVVATTYRIMNEDIPSLAGYPPAVQSVLRRALAKDPRDRFASAVEMRAALVAARREAAISPSAPPAFPAPSPERTTALPGKMASERTVAYAGEAAPPIAAAPPRETPQTPADPPRAHVPRRPGPLRRPALFLTAALLLGVSLGGAWFSWRFLPERPALPAERRSLPTEQDTVVYQRALYHYGTGRWEEAAAGFRQLAENSANIEVRAQAKLRLLYCYRRLGKRAAAEKDLAAAERWLRDALVLAPGDQQAARELTAVRKALGRAPEAVPPRPKTPSRPQPEAAIKPPTAKPPRPAAPGLLGSIPRRPPGKTP